MSEDLLRMPIADLIKRGLLKKALAAHDTHLSRIEEENKAYRSSVSIGLHVIKDTFSTLDGIKSHADGKMYSSKHKYYQSLKDKDSHIVEKGENAYHAIPNSTLRGDFDCSKELKQAIQQHLR